MQKFNNAEQLWFWFISSSKIRTLVCKKESCDKEKVCGLLDVEQLITKLYLSGKLTDSQLEVMKEFGDKRRAPHQHIWSENRKASLWRDAMATIESAAVKLGYIESDNIP